MPNQEVRRRGKSVDASGRDVEEAVENALQRLDRSRDEVEVTVLREGRSGLLGIGARDAIVRVTELLDTQLQGNGAEEEAPVGEVVAEEPEALADEEEPDERIVAEAEESEHVPVIETEDEERTLSELTDEQQQLLEISHEMLVELLTRMRVIADVQAYWEAPETPEDEPMLKMDIVGDDLGILIGRHGTTLRALQYVMRLMVGHKVEDYVNLVIDVDGYKERRAQKLRDLAQRKAEQVRREGTPVHLKPMTPYERRIVHVALRDNPDVTTESSGKGSNRRVGIFPK